ncbi:M14 family metallocarboxypeptidase [Bradyrhizobium sp.]|uniref:M14 family metallopeptidase n=1 Tax=Bradyrhizobium sp. TaxID=376 RepID=UPI002DDCA5EF|nr:M14 family metallocarboxypeptidase [Bradyrhizobium sp.]HEV2159477.1 M14 family metallocarboxypeptidase [Bradyrhizobium sp.]
MTKVVSRFAREVEPKLSQLKGCSVEQIARVDYGDENWPILCIRSACWEAARPTMLISGGLHGDEPAGVHAALAFVVSAQREFDADLQFVVFPCLNPSGFDAGTLQTQSGANLNRLFGIGSAQPEVRAVEDWLRTQARRYRMTFDLHEVRPDYVGEGFTEQNNPRGAYLYETVSDGSDRIGRLMIDALPAGRPVCDWPTIYNDINEAGVVSYPQGRRNEIYAQGTSLDAFLDRHYTGHAFTFETPTEWSLNDRVDTQLTFLKVALGHAAREAAVGGRSFRP